MNRVVLLIGGNQGDRNALIQQATELIRQRIGSVVAMSRIYETEPWGEFEVGSDELRVKSFLNCGLLVETALTAHQVLHEALAIEKELGRERTPVSPSISRLSPRLYHSRPIDIDIIFWNDEVVDTADLVVPHPRMHLRQFVLEPLCEIIPDYVHPQFGKTVRELYADLLNN